jgi:hypothetical protein
MLDPLTIGIGLLLWAAFRKQSGTEFGVLTPEREEVYRNALEYCQDPQRLRQLADNFEKEGLKAEAFVMKKRAEWRSRTPEVKAKHDAIFAKALESTNIQGILGVAQAFEQMTATVKAKQLQERVQSLQAAQIRSDIAAEAAADAAEHATIVIPEKDKPNVVETTAEVKSNGMSGHTPSTPETTESDKTTEV